MTKDFLYKFISDHHYAVLSAVTKDNFPEATLMGFAVSQELRIIFDTSNKSRKYENLIENPAIAFVIGWENEKTLQYEGIAKIPSKKELEELLPIYFEIFPDGKDRMENWKNCIHQQ